MKRLISKIILAGALLSLGLAGMPADKAPEPLDFTGVVQVKGATKDQLFNRAQAWFATTFNCGKCVMQTSDKEAGQIIGRGAFEYTSATFLASDAIKGWVTYTIKVFVKEGRYKYEVADFIHKGSKTVTRFGVGDAFSFGLITTAKHYPKIKHCTKGVCGKNWAKLKADCKKEAKTLKESLSQAMEVPPSGSEKW
jgi:hypothetical protein